MQNRTTEATEEQKGTEEKKIPRLRLGMTTGRISRESFGGLKKHVSRDDGRADAAGIDFSRY